MSVQNERYPVAVLISDIHYSLSTLSLADAALRQAINKAAELKVPVIIAGDLHDTKANLRGECVKKMLETFVYAKALSVDTIVIVGNHDLINEKGMDHSLSFLTNKVGLLVDQPMAEPPFYFIPYQNSAEAFQNTLNKVPKGSTVICHQGIHGADMGEYVLDKSAVHKDILADYRVISGHYHKAQNIKTGRPRRGAVGLMSYIGSPYTITFAEAKDGPKGFQILYSDGLLEQVPTKLRKHIVLEVEIDHEGVGLLYGACQLISAPNNYKPGDLLWVKLRGPSLELEKITKNKVAEQFRIAGNFKLDYIPTDSAPIADAETEKKTNAELMDLLIDKSDEKEQNKKDLKQLWRTLV